jgi:hypothetical protein
LNTILQVSEESKKDTSKEIGHVVSPKSMTDEGKPAWMTYFEEEHEFLDI